MERELLRLRSHETLRRVETQDAQEPSPAPAPVGVRRGDYSHSPNGGPVTPEAPARASLQKGDRVVVSAPGWGGETCTVVDPAPRGNRVIVTLPGSRERYTVQTSFCKVVPEESNSRDASLERQLAAAKARADQARADTAALKAMSDRRRAEQRAREPQPGEHWIGEQIEVHSLSGAPQHNGKSGVIEGYDANKGRYTVKLTGSGTQFALRPRNLKKRALAPEEPAPEAPGWLEQVFARTNTSRRKTHLRTHTPLDTTHTCSCSCCVRTHNARAHTRTQTCSWVVHTRQVLKYDRLSEPTGDKEGERGGATPDETARRGGHPARCVSCVRAFVSFYSIPIPVFSNRVVYVCCWC